MTAALPILAAGFFAVAAFSLRDVVRLWNRSYWGAKAALNSFFFMSLAGAVCVRAWL